MKRNFFIIIAITLISGFFFSNCNKEQQIGMNILPDEDNILTTIVDTFSIEVHTTRAEHINTTNAPYLLLGSYIDPIFGSTKASFITQLRQELYPNFPDSIVCVAIELHLPYSEVYGDSTAEQEIYVYEISSILSIEESYFSDTIASNFHNDNLLGTGTFDPTSAISRILKIPLDNEFGQLLIDNEEDYFETLLPFPEVFKGLYLTTNSEAIDAAIFKFPVNAPFIATNDFKLLLIYQDENDSGNSSRDTFELPVSTNSLRFNMFEHDYTNSYFYEQLNDPFTINDSIAFIQSMAGTKIRIKIPFIENLSENKNIIINKAELVVKQDPLSISDEYAPIGELAFVGYDEDDNVVRFNDFYNTQTGFYYGSSLSENEYRFNVTRIIQSLTSAEPYDFEFYFIDKSATYDFKRTVVTTGEHSDAMKLVVTYTEY